MSRKTQLVAALLLLAGLRLVAAALLPLTSDEAYYWLWSRHLAAGYYDHPPAIAWLIHAGTALFGNTEFGVRMPGVLLSFVASWFVWRSAVLLLKDDRAGALACLFFNLTLMITVETLAATPDAPQIFAAAAFVWTLAKVAETNDGRWWIAAGAVAGLGLLSKYSTLFLGVGALVWLASPPMRRWLVSPWPYAGGLLAAVIFAPNLLWNSQHGWATFVFQFGRIEGSHFTLRYLGEFVGAQALFATPFILILAVFGLSAASWWDKRQALIAAILLPSIAYFAWHSLHDRVQGNWPCFLYPLLAVAAADAMLRSDWTGWRKTVMRFTTKAAIPLAAVLLIAGYTQALVGVVPMGRKDPLARLLAVGFPNVVEHLNTLKQSEGALLTTDYASTAWFAFYSPFTVVGLGEDYRWPNASIAPAALFDRPALYVTEIRRDRHDLVAARFAQVTEIARFDRARKGIPIAHYIVYRASGPTSRDLGRMP